MGRSRYRVYQDDAPHFVTCTVLEWLPIFTRPEAAAVLLESLEHRRKQHGWRVYGYVVLENHCHLAIQAPNLSQQLPRFKSWTARCLIDLLQARGEERLLHLLAYLKKRHKVDRQYQLWEEGNHPQQIQDDEMMRQKLEYIHNNPVKRGYVDDPLCWRYSSARNYGGLEGLIEVDRAG